MTRTSRTHKHVGATDLCGHSEPRNNQATCHTLIPIISFVRLCYR